MEVEFEPRVKPLGFKVKAMSRESPTQKAAHVLDPDLRSHWSSGTNTKEWILLELDEPCLLSHIRIYNKSVLEWEITAGLRYKPESFIKVRARCESPRREVMYPMNYTPCRYVRISCLRGNPIAIFFIQLIGVSVAGLEPEFQPVVNYLLPHIISHKQETHDIHLQLLEDITKRLLVFLPQLETDLTNFTDTAESSIRYFAMLVGPFYPILRIGNEREAAKTLVNASDSDIFRNNQTSTLMVSSNFEAQPRRSRSPSHFTQTASNSIVFRPDAIIMLLRKAYKDFHLGIVCRLASRALQKLVEPGTSPEESPPSDLATSGVSDEIVKVDSLGHLPLPLTDYSSLFGEEYKILDDRCDTAYLNVMDIAAVEEGILHVLYACASQPNLCCKLADTNSDLWSTLPLVQALLPALRPPISSAPDQVDDSLWQWKHPFVQQAVSQIVAMASSSAYRPLLRACAGYLSSFMSSHAKAACVLIDLCCGPLSPWISTVTAKVDLAVELLEDLLGIIQGAHQSTSRARAALKYTILALSGHMDDVLAKYKEFKHNLLFLLEMLEPYLDPAITAINNTIAFGDVSGIFLEKQERTCAIALNIIRTALLKPAVLPSLESEWRRGSVAPSILISILGPHLQLPPEIDLCKCSVSKVVDEVPSNSSQHSHGEPLKSSSLDEFDRKNEVSEATTKIDGYEDANCLFAPRELKSTVLTSVGNYFIGNSPDKTSAELIDGTVEKVSGDQVQNGLILDNGFSVKYFNLQVDYLQLVNYQDCESRASEYQHLAMDLSSQYDINPESHDAVIDALLLAAECYVNPFFMMSFKPASKPINQIKNIKLKMNQNDDMVELKRVFERYNNDLEQVAHLERKRDKTVLHILLQAAKLDEEYERNRSKEELHTCYYKGNERSIDISPLDIQSLDAVTLVRQNQFLLCQFVMKQLQREQSSPHEVLLQSLLFLLHSATELSCPPKDVVDVILCSAENLNMLLTSVYYQLKEGKTQFDAEKLHGAQRRWMLLQRLVTASSGTVEGTDFISHTRYGFQYRSLVPPSSWIQKISKFSNCPFPLVRFLGWMAVSHYAQQYLKDRLFLASDLSQLSSLLSIFADDLASVGNVKDQKFEILSAEQSNMKQYLQVGKELGSSDHSDCKDSFHILYPDLHKFFPNMQKQFRMFGESILEAVGVQLKYFPSNALPDVLCWFSDLCLSPYPEPEKGNLSLLNQADCLKGHVSTNVKAILLYALESIVGEHMEAMLPEMPRVAQILISICRSSYCDVPFLDSVLCLLRPLISYFLRKVAFDEKFLTDAVSGPDFDLENFKELFEFLRLKEESHDSLGEKEIQGSLMIFTLGSLFCDLSFRRKSEVLQSLLLWVDFATSEPTSSFYNYLHAFQKVMDSCNTLLAQSIESFGIHIPVEKQQSSEANATLNIGGDSTSPSGFQTNVGQSFLTKSVREDSNGAMTGFFGQGVYRLSSDEMSELSQHLELLISKLIPSVEICWNLHYKLAMKLTFALAKCFMYSTCLASVIQATKMDSDDGGEICLSESRDLLSRHWGIALVGLSKIIVTIQQNRNWQVASAMMEYLLRLPQEFSLDCVIDNVCSAIKSFCCHAPRFSWRLQSDKWLSLLFTRDNGNIDADEGSVAEMFHAMLGHSEPEQRAVALQHLGRIVGLGTNDEMAKVFYTLRQSLVGSASDIPIPESFLSILVSSTWDMVATLAFTDPSLLLRRHAMALLSGYIPFAKRGQLQSFLVASNTIIRGVGRLSLSMEEVHLTRLSLSLLASVCLYSPAEDITLIPESVWENLESMGMSRSGELDLMEKNLCSALCKIRNEPIDAEEVLNGVLSSNSVAKQIDPNFKDTRETILQVLSSLTSVQSYFDFFSKKIEQDSQELEEAEIEMNLLQKEKAKEEVSASSKLETPKSHQITYDLKENDRLQKIKDDIRSLEKSKIREEIVARRQKKLLMRQARQKFLEEAALKEMKLLQDLDRERASELEREIERERILELERAKTRELQYNLDIERERQTQRELQREMEQLESGIRPSRRDFSSSATRPRERYRESGRSGQEGSIRASSRGHEGGGGAQAATSGANITSQAPTIVLTGARSFSGQVPTILQTRDRAEERSGGYEDNLEGSRDSGDASSVGDPELSSAFDGFGSASRHGSRGGKSRQVAERRDREGRGKWERKHN